MTENTKTNENEVSETEGVQRCVMPYAVEQRLRLIHFLLSQYGHVNRSAIMDYFGIGAATATRDFKAYKKLCEGNMVYDDYDKAYYKTHHFKRVWA